MIRGSLRQHSHTQRLHTIRNQLKCGYSIQNPREGYQTVAWHWPEQPWVFRMLAFAFTDRNDNS